MIYNFIGKCPDNCILFGTFKEWPLNVAWSKQQLQTNYRLRQLYQSVNNYLRLHSLQRNEVKARADTRLLLITSRIECIIACRILIQLKYVWKYIFMSRPEWAQNHKINGTLKGHGKMALIVHYILVGIIWVS